jgi:hypothetical protein
MNFPQIVGNGLHSREMIEVIRIAPLGIRSNFSAGYMLSKKGGSCDGPLKLIKFIEDPL